MKKTKCISVFLATLLVFSGLWLNTTAAAAEVDGTRITSMGAIVIDFETGMEIYAFNADVRRGPASMTKMMTVYLVYEAIANGIIGFDTIVPISQNAYNASRTSGETNVPLMRNLEYTVDELLDVIVVMSAGGACTALAELIAGTTRAFHRLMNAKAAEWGIDAVFNSVSGGVQYTQLTPRAMAELTRRTIMDFPDVLKKTSMPTVTFRGRTIPSTNDLLGVYEGIDGFKTGTHAGTRANFSGTAQRGDIRIISVTMGSSSSGRFNDTRILLDYGFKVMEEFRQAIEARKVAPTIRPAIVSGARTELETFDIEGGRFYNIRDIAYVVNGTDVQFDVKQDQYNNTLTLISGVPYTEIGGEMTDRGGERKLPELLAFDIIINGEKADLPAFDIEGNIYLRLEDIKAALGFGMVWKRDDNAYILNIITGAEPQLPPIEPEIPPTSTPPPSTPAPTPAPTPTSPDVTTATATPGTPEEPTPSVTEGENTQAFPLWIIICVAGVVFTASVIGIIITRRRA